MSYYNVTEVESALSALAAAYPALTDLITLPETTYEGRTSHALRIGTGSVGTKDGVLFIGGVHAREWGSCEICINFATDMLAAYTSATGLVYGGKSFTSTQVKAIVENLHVFVFPLVNPDGRHHSQNVEPFWRRNRNPSDNGGNPDCTGVDINRNFDFLWDFRNLFSPVANISVSDDPCALEDHTPGSGTYHGSAPFSEVETRNVRWLLDTYPRIRWFVDIHSYSKLILHVWGDDQNQTTDAAMTFTNTAYDSARGVDGDTEYLEYITANDLNVATGIANRMRDAILAVRGENYTAQQSFHLYGTSGTSDDYAYSRHLVDPGKAKVHAFCVEWGTAFQPPWSEMENIIVDITSGLIEFCLSAPCEGGLVEVDLDTPTIHFNDVPEGETAARAAVFSVSACGAVTFEITSGPTLTSGAPGTSFGTPLGTSVTLEVAATLDPRKAHVWISYTGTNNGDTANGTVSILCVETGDVWSIPITANTISRPTAAVVLALDQSNSMTFDSGFGAPLLTRNDVLKYSAQPFVEVIHEDDALGIVTFDHDAYDVVPPMPPTPAGSPILGAGRTTARGHILSHTPNPAGWTSIGDGVELAHSRLEPVTDYDVKAIVVFTDGHENRSKFLEHVTDINGRVYGIGLGTAEEIQPDALTTLTNGTGGYLLLTGALDADRFFQLSKYFLQILAGVENASIVVDPEARLLPGVKVCMPFHLNEADITSDVILLAPAPQAIQFALEAPNGKLLTPTVASTTTGADFFTASNAAFYRLTLPVPLGEAGAGPGQWKAIFSLDDKYFDRYVSNLKDCPKWQQDLAVHGMRFAFMVHAYSSLRLNANLSQDSFEPGATLTLRAVLTEHSIPLGTGAKVQADLTKPDNTSTALTLAEVDQGVFETTVNSSLSGIYRFRVRARGNTLSGLPFTREQELTGTVWKGGDNHRPSDSSDSDDLLQQLCGLLTCLFSSKNISAKLAARLMEMGVNLAGLRKCLEIFCADGLPSSTDTIKLSKEELVKLIEKLDTKSLDILKKIAVELEEGC